MAVDFVEVAFPIPLNKTFHYQAQGGKIGNRVLAPFGPKKNLVGYVVGRMSEKPAFPTKEIVQWLDTEPFLDAKLIELARWIANRYLCSVGEALASMAPPALSEPKRIVPAAPEETPHKKTTDHVLTLEQKHALEPIVKAIDSKMFQPFLLRGITNSGKTEIYLRAIDRALQAGQQALFLLPEIALTPPFYDQLRARYGAAHVGLWHSVLSAGERYRTWTGVKNGTLKILLGARSAVFAPFPDLGVLILDEEHESAYKQEERPRYHTREVAFKRAELTSATLIMGSATPSLESYWRAKQGVYTLLELTSRVEQRSLPPVELIDMRPRKIDSAAPERPTKRVAPFSVFSEALKIALEQRLARREQTMLFVNRRGFTPFLRCSKCGWVSRCARCSTTMSLHLGNLGPEEVSNRYMQCHACARRERVPIQCPACQSMRIHQFGVGTQKVEEELNKLFPFAKVARLDRDVASLRRSHEKIYRSFVDGKLDVLVGTQMIAKGFDFPHVTLVGVVDADVSLHLPDFRSAERTFDLLTQVAGRTGRGEFKGKVLVQTHHPEHYALQAAREHDYVGFYEHEIADRETLHYPPFCRLVNVVLRAPKEPAVLKSAEDLYERLEKLASGVELLGPVLAPYSRIRNQFRYQILMKGTDETLAPCLGFLRTYRASKSFITVDVDPVDLL